MVSAREERYRPLKLRTLVNYQIQYLARKFDLSRESRIAELVIRKINDTIAAAEAEIGIQRIQPFELFLKRKRKGLALPLFKPAYLAPILTGETFAESRELVEEEARKRLTRLDSKTAKKEVLRYIYPWQLVRRSGPVSWVEALNSGVKEEESQKRHAAIRAIRPQPPSQRLKTPDLSAPEHVVEMLATMVEKEAGFGRTVARHLVEEVIALRNLCSPRMQVLKSGEVPMLVTHVRAHLSEEIATKFRRLAPVIVTLWEQDELEKRLPQTVPAFLEQLERRLIRVCFEAYRQNGLLTLMELQWLFQMSLSRISEVIRAFQKKHQIIVPTPGTVLDAGRSRTHKDIVVRLHLAGHNVKEIAQRTYHSPRAVDNYIGTFESVLILKLFRVPLEIIARLLHKGVTLIKEHMDLIDELYPTEQEIKEYLLSKGVKF